jgi:hypothetical protein
LIIPIISFALRACTSLGTPPATSISSTIPYPWPMVSTATGGSVLAAVHESTQRAAVMLDLFLPHQLPIGPGD